MPLLRNIGKNAGELNTLTEQIIRVEERADELHDEGRKALFLANPRTRNGMNFTIGTEIYDHLEKVVDRLEDVANEINALVDRSLCRRAMDLALSLPVLVGLIATALVFDFLNGLHDAANSIATIVSTRVLASALCGALGGILQFHRLPVLRPARRADRRHRHRCGGCRRWARDLRRADGRDLAGTSSRGGPAFRRAARTR